MEESDKSAGTFRGSSPKTGSGAGDDGDGASAGAEGRVRFDA